MTCNVCQTCNSGCQTCVTCQSCDTCNRGCQSCQSCDDCESICQIEGQDAGSFSFSSTIAPDKEFLTASEWNGLLTYIQKAYDTGTVVSGGSSHLPSSVSPNIEITADMFNKVSDSLNNLGYPNLESTTDNNYKSQGKRKKVVKDVDWVYASYFEDLATYANNLKYKNTQCNNNCNVDCQSCDDGCQTCNTCQSCEGSCQSHSPSACYQSSPSYCCDESSSE